MLCQRITGATTACVWLAFGLTACTPEEKERVLSGDAKIATAADVENLAQYTAITGRLTVKRAALKEIVLPRLKTVGGKLYVQKNADLRSLRLPALGSIGSEDGDVAIIERNPVLTEVDLGGLKTAAYQISVRNNDALRRVNLGALTEIVGTGLEIADNPALQEISVPGLLVAASVSITECGSLRRVVLSDLKNTGALVVEGNDQLEILDARGLERVAAIPDSAVPVCRLSIVGNGSLKALDGLKSLAGASPTCAIDVRDNGELPTCDVDGLLQRIKKAGWPGVPALCGNKIDACGGGKCPGGEGRPDAGP